MREHYHFAEELKSRMNWTNYVKTLALLALLLSGAPALNSARAQDGPLVSTPKKQPATTTTGAPAPAQTPAQKSAEPAPQTAQGASTSAATARLVTPPISAGDTRYRIGPGDVLEIRVLKAPELSREAVRVDQSGMIRIPMFENDVQAACLTEGELAQKIATLYLKYKKHPHVDVFVKEFQSQPVAVVGAVNTPGQFKLQRQVRLLELLTYAGGQAERAGQSIQVVHAGGPSICEKPAESQTAAGETVGNSVSTYRLSDTLMGLPDANPYVRPGDIISLPAADQVFVIGNVVKPTSIALREPTTVSRAIAMAGGLGPAGKKSRVHIVRQQPGPNGAKTDFYVDLAAIEKRKAADVPLQANDIIEVGTSTGKSILSSLLGVIAPTVTQGAVRVIP